MSGRAQRTRTGSGLGERRIPTDPAEKGQECPPAHLWKEGSRSKSEGDTMLCVGRQVGGRGGDRGGVRSCCRCSEKQGQPSVHMAYGARPSMTREAANRGEGSTNCGHKIRLSTLALRLASRLLLGPLSPYV